MSHTCSFTDLLTTFTTLEPNSTPIVWLESCLTEGERDGEGEKGREREGEGERGGERGGREVGEERGGEND